MTHNWSATAFYFNEYGQLIGHDAEQVNAWLADHADYHGHIYMNYGQDDPDITVTDIFRLDAVIRGIPWKRGATQFVRARA